MAIPLPNNDPKPKSRRGHSYEFFRRAVTDIQTGAEQLPSLPGQCLRVCRACADANTTVVELTAMVRRDPALSAFLQKTACSPLYRTSQGNPSLEQAIRLLGFPNIGNLTLLHSVRSIFFQQDRSLKPLFSYVWKNLALKASLAILIARACRFSKIDKAMLAASYTEIGPLMIITALKEEPQKPNLIEFQRLSHTYGNTLGRLVLEKWQAPKPYLQTIKLLGAWQLSPCDKLTLLDVTNIAHYHALKMGNHPGLPRLEQLTCFAKLPKSVRQLNERGLLKVVMDEQDAVNQSTQALLN
jgi:HD-like signal output (HDOD) protein